MTEDNLDKLRDAIRELLKNPTMDHDYGTCIDGESGNAHRGCGRCIIQAFVNEEEE